MTHLLDLSLSDLSILREKAISQYYINKDKSEKEKQEFAKKCHTLTRIIDDIINERLRDYLNTI